MRARQSGKSSLDDGAAGQRAGWLIRARMGSLHEVPVRCPECADAGGGADAGCPECGGGGWLLEYFPAAPKHDVCIALSGDGMPACPDCGASGAEGIRPHGPPARFGLRCQTCGGAFADTRRGGPNAALHRCERHPNGAALHSPPNV